MSAIKCSGENCSEIFETNEPVSPNVKYTCRFHTPKVEHSVFFQEHQFDKDLRRAGRPIGTDHIKNQGSDILTADEIGLPYGWEEPELDSDLDLDRLVGICGECGYRWYEDGEEIDISIIGKCPECGNQEGINE
jgi:hypothetical protein